MKRAITDLLIILAAVIGGTFLLKKGEETNAGKMIQASAPPEQAAEIPVRPRAILGRLDNFKENIVLQPIRSWGKETKQGIMLRVSPDPKLNRPSARVVLIPPTSKPVVLEIQYTVAQNIVEALLADEVVRDKTDGVTVLVTTVGVGYNQSTLLTLDPIREVEQRRWAIYNLALPLGTEEIHFSIIGPPPNYNVLEDSCAISVPQLRVAPAKAPAASSE